MIKKWVGTIVLIFIYYLLQTTLFSHLELANVVPNLLLILTVSAGYLRGQKDGLITGLLCGLLSDIIFGSVIGLYGLIYMIIGYINGYGAHIYLRNSFYIPLALVGISDIIYGVMFYIFEFLLRGRLNFIFYFKTIILPEAVYTVIVAVVFYNLFYFVNKITASSKAKEAL